jgi:CubicO group peptidase (beta-lactamase class C family)
MREWAIGAGAVVSTAADVAKWDDAFFSGRIITMKDVKLATTPHVLPSGQSTPEGFAWDVDTYDGQTRYMYTGRTFAFTAENEYFPKLRQTLVVLTNTANEQVNFIAGAAFEALHPAIATKARTPANGEDEQALKPFGPLTSLVYRGDSVDRNGAHYQYLADFPGASFLMAMSIEPNGKISDISLLPR